MEFLELTDRNLKIINFIEHPSLHVIVRCQSRLTSLNVDITNESSWVEFEKKYSADNFSGFSGEALHQVVLLLSIVNTQGGLASPYINKVKNIKREQLVRLYHKYMQLRTVAYSRETYELVSQWLLEKNYISELEYFRLVGYRNIDRSKPAILDDFNHNIMREDIFDYVTDNWKRADKTQENNK